MKTTPQLNFAWSNAWNTILKHSNTQQRKSTCHLLDFTGIYTNLQMIYFSNENVTFLLEMNLSATNASAHDKCMQTYTCVAPYVVFFHVGSFFRTDKQTKEEQSIFIQGLAVTDQELGEPEWLKKLYLVKKMTLKSIQRAKSHRKKCDEWKCCVLKKQVLKKLLGPQKLGALRQWP